MSRLLRIILGLSVVTALFPVLTNAFVEEVSTRAIDARPANFEQRLERALAVHFDPPSSPGAESAGGHLAAVAQSGESKTSSDDPAHTAHTEPSHSTTLASTSQTVSTTGDSNPTTTEQDASPATTERTTTTQSDDETSISGTITGEACPCTVTGTVELIGDISLQGDLTVDGGTLVARPGVNVVGNGFQIIFILGGKADFQGTPVFTWSGDGSNANLKRDINFTGLRRIMFTGNAGASVLRYFTVRNSGTPEFDDYPLHWHLNGDSTRGTIVEGVVVVNGANHAFVPHGSNGITFKDTIAKDTAGDAYWWNPPGTNETCSFQKFCTLDNSNDITYDHALVYGVTNGPTETRGFRLAGFTLGAGSGNVVKNSAAINISPSTVKDCAGFQWPEGANQNVGGNVWTFVNNFSISASGCAGIFVWQNDGNPHVIEGFSGGGINHGAYANNYEYRDVDVPYLIVHAAGWRVAGGRIGTVTAVKHRNTDTPTVQLDNVSVGRFVINNAVDSGDVPGYYVLNNTGLECGDIEYQNVVPGTRVFIDDVEC
jgi:hypothetical protein